MGFPATELARERQGEVRWGVKDTLEFDIPAGPFNGPVPNSAQSLCWVKDVPRVWSIQIYAEARGLQLTISDTLAMAFEINTGVGSAMFKQYVQFVFSAADPGISVDGAFHKSFTIPATPADFIEVNLKGATIVNTTNPLHRGSWLVSAAAAPYTRLREDQ